MTTTHQAAAAGTANDNSTTPPRRKRKSADPTGLPESYPRWPVVLLAGSAFVAIWGGWVELGRMSGFGPVNLLPGIAELYVDLAITLPLGMEVYAAYAMGAWLTRKRIDDSARSFAKWSALASLVVGGAGQVAYHLLAAAGIQHAPWQVVVIVSCVPVAVLGMASMLAHRLHVPHHSPAEREAEPASVEAVPTAEIAAVVDRPTTAVPSSVLELPGLVRPQPAAVSAYAAAGAATFEEPDSAVPAKSAETGGAERKRGPVTDEERSEIVAIFEETGSVRATALRASRTRDTVTRVLNHAGVLPVDTTAEDDDEVEESTALLAATA
ncbi:hypothetical protein [Agromyces bauzanensis]